MRKLIYAFLLITISLISRGQTLHVLLVMDQAEKDKNLGRISQADEKQINDVIQTMGSGINYRIKKEYIMNDEIDPDAIRNKINSLSVNSSDIVFFYYSGDGYYPDSKSKFPTIKPRESTLTSIVPSGIRSLWEDEPLSIKEVGDLLKSKGGRLNIVMADCRDNTIKVPVIPPPRGTEMDVSSSRSILNKLMKSECGLVIVASSHDAQPVWAAAPVSGSVFTLNFKQSFDALFFGNTKINNVSWLNLLKDTKKEMSGLLKGVNKRQEPVWDIETKTCQ